MLLISRHLTEYNIVPANAVIRINLAWEPDWDTLARHISELSQHVFLDVPSGRAKPPCHKYSLHDVKRLATDYPNVRYVGVSRVDDVEDVMGYIVKMPERVLVVPKIESITGCVNLADIVSVLKEPRTIMLDHDDLFHDLLEKGELPERLYTDYIDHLVELCRLHKVWLLRTAGVIFSDRM